MKHDCSLAKVFCLFYLNNAAPQTCASMLCGKELPQMNYKKQNSQVSSIKRRKHLHISRVTENKALRLPRVSHCCDCLCVGTLWFNDLNLVSPVQPPPQKLLTEHAQTLERYAWESFDPHSQGKYTFISTTAFLHPRNSKTFLMYVGFLLRFQRVRESCEGHLFEVTSTRLLSSLFFSDLSPGECLPAPAISSGEFHHPHTCTVHRISWSILPRKGKMVVMTFMRHR